jgi:hypothetical protein
MTDDLTSTIPGADEVSRWFGNWPVFHDAEISKLELHSDSVITFNLYAWNMTKDLDEKGYYINEKYADVSFRLEEVSAINITDLTEVGILFGLDIEKQNDLFTFVINASYGINGTITCKRCSVKLDPR